MSVMITSDTQIVETSAVNAWRQRNGDFSVFVNASMNRFLSGDWGEMDSEDDRAMNDNALKAWQENDAVCDRILAVYKTDLVDEGKIWIIEEWDRSIITILFPSDY